MRVKSKDKMNQILEFAMDFIRQNGRSPSTREIAEEIGTAKGTAHTYLIRMNELGMIKYDGRTISSETIRKINHGKTSTPVVGRVVCGTPAEEQEAVEEYVDLPESIFGKGEKFILRAYGDSMNKAGIEEGDFLVVTKGRTAQFGDIVIALYDNENTCKRYRFDEEKGVPALFPESTNKKHKPIALNEKVVLQGIVTHIIKNAK